MKALILSAILLASTSYAMPNPQYVPLMNTSEFGKYVEKNMTPIIESSVELARRAIPNSHYFLITRSIAITAFDQAVEAGKSPFAILTMVDGSSGLTCERGIFVSVKTDEWGEARQLTFAPANEIACRIQQPVR